MPTNHIFYVGFRTGNIWLSFLVYFLLLVLESFCFSISGWYVEAWSTPSSCWRSSCSPLIKWSWFILSLCFQTATENFRTYRSSFCSCFPWFGRFCLWRFNFFCLMLFEYQCSIRRLKIEDPNKFHSLLLLFNWNLEFWVGSCSGMGISCWVLAA